MIKTSKKNRSVIVVAVCLVIIFITGLVSLGVKTNNGEYIVKEITLSPYGSDLAASMYIPKSALLTDTNGNFVQTVPAVIVNAGFTNSRTFLDNVAIELARCGFAVIHIDMYGHGFSESTDIRGYGNNPSPFDDDTSLCGATDALAYLRTLGFIDQTRIGMCGHSLGGSASGRMAEKSAGFYTLQDKLLNMLYIEFGITITEAQVAAQDANAISATLNEDELALYKVLKEQIASEHSIAVRNYMIFDAGASGCTPHEVEVAGIPVWRDVQANIGLLMNMSGNGSGGTRNRDAHLSSDSTLTMLSLDSAASRNIWYELNLSTNSERLLSTKLTDFYSSASDAVQEAAASHNLRMVATPFGWHGFTYLSAETAKAAGQFFRTALAYNNGASVTGTHWVLKDFASGIGFIALLILILPLVDIIMRFPFFASLQGTPQEPTQSKKSPLFWIFMAIFVAIPAITYSKGIGWGAFIKASPFSTLTVSTQVAFWAFIMTLILFALIIIKYFVFDKKTGISFGDMYGLKNIWKNIGKSTVLALVVFACVSLVLTLYYNLFAAGNLKITPGGAIIFTALSKMQYYNWLLYAIYFLPFYLLNSMVVNSARLKDMSEKANMWMIALVNSIGMIALAVCQFLIGYVPMGKTLFATPPGSSSFVYNISVLMVMLFVSAIYTRKLYLKTGSAIPGALLNVAIFMIPSIQVYMYYSFL